jgi:glucokinase
VKKEYVLGIDLGGTNIRGAAVGAKGNIWEILILPTETSRGRGRVVGNLSRLIKALRRKLTPKEPDLLGVGIGAAGGILQREGIISQSPNISPLDGFRLREHLEKEFRLPVFLENDANCGALGEKWVGAGRGVNDLGLVTLGTGVGGGLILGGKLWRGIDGTAGEIGHMTINSEGPECLCGSRGCLEVYSSATAIVRRLKEEVSRGERTQLVGRQGISDRITSKDIHQAALAGDRLSRRLFREMGRYLGIGIANLINILNLEMVVIGGGVSGAWELFMPTMKREVRKRAFKVPARRVRILKSRLGVNAGLLGAASLVWQGAVK